MNAATKPIKIALVGLGKIAIDQHIPALANNPAFDLVAGCSRQTLNKGLKVYTTLDALFDAVPELDAVSLCTPPKVRYEMAVQSILAGKHVFLEKPPAASLGEAEALKALAAQNGVSILASWHSRFAPAVGAIRNWVLPRALKSVTITWKEDVRRWHPGQDWIFEVQGMGVFDPGINAFSILTKVIPERVLVIAADLHIPSNVEAPIQAEIDMQTASGVPIRVELDFLQTGQQTWSLLIEAQSGERLSMHLGGAKLEIDGALVLEEKEAEYPGLYAHFAKLIGAHQSDIDLEPLRLVADCALVGKRKVAASFKF
jgi:D-galactose 1-dehydrogenase